MKTLALLKLLIGAVGLTVRLRWARLVLRLSEFQAAFALVRLYLRLSSRQKAELAQFIAGLCKSVARPSGPPGS